MAIQRQHTIRGKVVFVNKEKHFGFVKPLDKVLPAAVTTNVQGGFFMPPTAMDVVPEKGDTGTFVIIPGDERGWKVKSVVEWDRVAEEATPQPEDSAPSGAGSPADSFIHPYNFVRLPSPDALQHALGIEPFKRGPSAPHDHYDGELQTGYIDCKLTTHTDWFIPDPRKVHKPGDHATLGYFTLEPVDASRWGDQPDQTQPAIPGSSLRGMVRSVFEAATLSCMSVFDAAHLDFRMGRDLEDTYRTTIPAGRGKPRYVPCRIETIDEGGATIQLLDGRKEDKSDRDHPIVLRMAPIHAYEKSVRYRKDHRDRGSEGIGTATKTWSDLVTLPDGTQWKGNRVVVVIDANPRKLSDRHRFRVREVLAAVRADGAALADADLDLLQQTVNCPPALPHDALDRSPRQPHVVFGYLHRTGPNIENKHHERIFFRWAEYNQIGAQGTVAERYQRFLEEQANSNVENDALGVYHTIDAPVLNDSLQRLKDYAKRQPGKEAKSLEEADCDPPRMIRDSRIAGNVEPPYPSDFVRADAKQIKWRRGDTCYALLEGEGPNATIHGMFPVALPRLRHVNSRGELLPFDLYPCSAKHRQCPQCGDACEEKIGGFCKTCFDRQTQLCPACRVFGWVRDLSGTSVPSASSRVDAWAGHVRFTHGVYKSGDYHAREVPLAILGSPKPTTTMFYLRAEAKDPAKQKATRWPPALQNLGQPLYRRSEAELRGRKFYRRREEVFPHRNEPALGGLRRKDDVQDGQNQTAFILPTGIAFSFRVYFDNLSRQELGALLFALSLQVPEAWRQQLPDGVRLSHSLGHGKPLGMGRCSIAVTSVCVEGPERYRAENFIRPTNPSAGRKLADEDTKPFIEAWDKLNGNRELVHVREQLLEMLAVVPAGEPIHYPLVEIDNRGRANFDWWRNAKQTGVTFPDPIEERQQPEKRLKE